MAEYFVVLYGWWTWRNRASYIYMCACLYACVYVHAREEGREEESEAMRGKGGGGTGGYRRFKGSAEGTM